MIALHYCNIYSAFYVCNAAHEGSMVHVHVCCRVVAMVMHMYHTIELR